MSEVTTRERIEQFNAMARIAKPNGDCSYSAQHFFKTQIMGITDPKLLMSLPVMAPATRESVHQSMLDGMAKVVKSLTDAEFPIAASYETLNETIPEHETGIRHTLRKIALTFGMTNAIGFGNRP